jgi:hypothetical protein
MRGADNGTTKGLRTACTLKQQRLEGGGRTTSSRNGKNAPSSREWSGADSSNNTALWIRHLFRVSFFLRFHYYFSSERTTCTIPISLFSSFPFVCVCTSLWGNIPGEGFRFHSISSPPFVFHHCMSVLSSLVVSR